jgi:hypothetical protein
MDLKEAREKHEELKRAALRDPGLYALVEHHAPSGKEWPYCTGCDEGSWAEDSADWPCSSIVLVAPFLVSWRFA